jgi:hypothetical protein
VNHSKGARKAKNAFIYVYLLNTIEMMSRKIVIWILIPSIFVGITVGLIVINSASATEECKPTECATVSFNGTKYELRDAAFSDYRELKNIEGPLFTMKAHSEILDEKTKYLINLEGPIAEVESLIQNYNVTISDSKRYHGDKDLISAFGFVSKAELIRFLDENDAESLKSQSVAVVPVASYVSPDGVLVERASFLSENEKSELAEKYSAFKDDNIAEILKGNEGVNSFEIG